MVRGHRHFGSLGERVLVERGDHSLESSDELDVAGHVNAPTQAPGRQARPRPANRFVATPPADARVASGGRSATDTWAIARSSQGRR